MSITVSRTGRALVITLDRPDKRNAISSAMVDDLTAAVNAAGRDPTTVAIALRGRGAHFCAGADISEYHEAPEAHLRSFTLRARHLCQTLQDSPIPVVAAVTGVALGGGMELCLASDIVLADPTASFGLPELRLGLIPGWGGTQRLPRIVGPQAAAHLVLTSGRLDADAAHRRGLVMEVSAADELDELLERVLTDISTQSRGAVVAAKLALAAADTPAGDDVETAWLLDRFRHPDGIEGVAAFSERRPPRFSDGPEDS